MNFCIFGVMFPPHYNSPSPKDLEEAIAQEEIMIYELALVAKAGLIESEISTLKTLVHETVKAHEGEILIEDEWGRLTLGQPTKSGFESGHFIYMMFKANNENNKELVRRFRINEGVLRHLIIKMGEDKDMESLVKAYKTPFSKKYKGSLADSPEGEEDDMDLGNGEDSGDRKRFSRKRSCWFSAKGIQANWKDPGTYGWLLNEFGKISPARVSNISKKHQRFATTAIKRARNVGLLSFVSGRLAR